MECKGSKKRRLNILRNILHARFRKIMYGLKKKCQFHGAFTTCKIFFEITEAKSVLWMPQVLINTRVEGAIENHAYLRWGPD